MKYWHNLPPPGRLPPSVLFSLSPLFSLSFAWALKVLLVADIRLFSIELSRGINGLGLSTDGPAGSVLQDKRNFIVGDIVNTSIAFY